MLTGGYLKWDRLRGTGLLPIRHEVGVRCRVEACLDGLRCARSSDFKRSNHELYRIRRQYQSSFGETAFPPWSGNGGSTSQLQFCGRRSCSTAVRICIRGPAALPFWARPRCPFQPTPFLRWLRTGRFQKPHWARPSIFGRGQVYCRGNSAPLSGAKKAPCGVLPAEAISGSKEDADREEQLERVLETDRAKSIRFRERVTRRPPCARRRHAGVRAAPGLYPRQFSWKCRGDDTRSR